MPTIDKPLNIGIVGATGYVGLELVRLLSQHPSVAIAWLTSHSYAGKQVGTVYPQLTGLPVSDMLYQSEALDTQIPQADVVFFALPHGQSAHKLNAAWLAPERCFIDMGADFRLKRPEDYQTWYHEPHPQPQLLAQAVYGAPEKNVEALKTATLIANPGCYATASNLSLLPLFQPNCPIHIDPSRIIIDAKSGVSGAGRALSLDTHYTECNESLKAYKVEGHRHIAEIEQLLESPAPIRFTPHLVPMNRGILATCYVPLSQKTSADTVHEHYQQFYQHEPFVRVLPLGQTPETRWVKGTNRFDIGLVVDQRTQTLVVLGALDNMIKGAAGQAIQNMNIRFGLPQTTGLNQVAMFP